MSWYRLQPREYSFPSLFARTAEMSSQLVCIGVYQAYMATEVSGKILAIHLPIFTFVACVLAGLAFSSAFALTPLLADALSTTSLPTCFPFLYP